MSCVSTDYLLMFCCVFTTHAQRGWTPLISAALNGYADCVHLLLNAGADTNAKTGVRVDSCIWSGFAAVHLLPVSLLEWCFECIGWYSISVEAPFSRLIFVFGCFDIAAVRVIMLAEMAIYGKHALRTDGRR